LSPGVLVSRVRGVAVLNSVGLNSSSASVGRGIPVEGHVVATSFGGDVDGTRSTRRDGSAALVGGLTARALADGGDSEASSAGSAQLRSNLVDDILTVGVSRSVSRLKGRPVLAVAEVLAASPFNEVASGRSSSPGELVGSEVSADGLQEGSLHGLGGDSVPGGAGLNERVTALVGGSGQHGNGASLSEANVEQLSVGELASSGSLLSSQADSSGLSVRVEDLDLDGVNGISPRDLEVATVVGESSLHLLGLVADALSERAVNNSGSSFLSVVSNRSDSVSIGVSLLSLRSVGVSLEVLGVVSVELDGLSLSVEVLLDSVSSGDTVSNPGESDGGLSALVVVTSELSDSRDGCDGASYGRNSGLNDIRFRALDRLVVLSQSNGSDADAAVQGDNLVLREGGVQDSAASVLSGLADALVVSESVTGLKSVVTSRGGRPLSEDAGAARIEVESLDFSDSSSRGGAASDSLDRVDRGVTRVEVVTINSGSDHNVESVSVHEEEGTVSEGEHGDFARKLVLSSLVHADNFFPGATNLLVLGFDNVSINLVGVSSLGKLPADEHVAVAFTDSDNGSGHLDGLGRGITALNLESSSSRPSVVDGASSKRIVGSHAEFEGSTLDGSSSDSVAVEDSAEEGRVQVDLFPVVSGVQLSHLSFEVGGVDTGVTRLVGSGPGDGGERRAGGQVEAGASSLQVDVSSADGRRLTPGSTTGSFRVVLNSEPDRLAGFELVVSVELVEGDIARLRSGECGVALALRDGDPGVVGCVSELIGNLEHDSAGKGTLGEVPGSLDSGESVDTLGRGGRSSSPVGGQVLAGVDSDGGDKDVSGAKVSVAVHDVEGDEGSPEEEHHDRREDSGNTGSTEFSANNEASEGEDHEADD